MPLYLVIMVISGYVTYVTFVLYKHKNTLPTHDKTNGVFSSPHKVITASVNIASLLFNARCDNILTKSITNN